MTMELNRFMTSCGIIIVVVVLSGAAWGRDGMITDEAMAEDWLRELDKMMSAVYSNVVRASWNYNVNLTEYNNNLQVEASLKRSEFEKEVHRNASRFDWKNFKNPDLVRKFLRITDIGWSILPIEDVRKLDSLRNNMQLIYSTAEVCDRPKTSAAEASDNKTCLPQNPDLATIVATSRNWDEQLWAWKGWRDMTGKKMKSLYSEHASLLNKAAVMNNFKDNGEYWRSAYEINDLENTTRELWEQVKPLYQQLHAYVRRKLMATYSKNLKEFPNTGHIPAHITGNIWAQTWSNIYDLVTPFPNIPVLDITDILVRKGFDEKRMFVEADLFFQSLGLPKMPNEFWNGSMIVKPKDGRKVVCHASAWDFYNSVDFRIKQCTELTGEYFFVTHHEMGHVQYYLLYRHLPIVYRRGGNPGFHEAVGDVIALSVNTPQHMHKIGLMDSISQSKESEINFLMKQALEKIAFLPFGYLIDRWRWEVFDGRSKPDNYNRNYWKLRCKEQGISPPIPRTEEDFDPGCKYHVPNSTPYIRYFVSYIIQFQFHKSLCIAAGHKGPLHHCDIYNSTAAGEKLRKMLELGSSKHWPDAMEVLTGGRRMDAGPLLEYFKPLRDWLENENRGHPVGWEDDCPPEAFSSKTSQLHGMQSASLYASLMVAFAMVVTAVALAP